MNILLHLSYGLIIGRYIHIGGDNYLVIGGWLLGIFIFLFLISIFCSWCIDIPIPFIEVLYNYYKSFKEFKELKTIRELFYYYRKLPPKIFIYAKGMHAESKEVWEESKEVVIEDRDIYEVGGVAVISFTNQHYHTIKETIKYESDWGRVSQGGGKMDKSNEDKRYNCKKSVETTQVTTFDEESEYIYESWQDITYENDELFQSDYPVLNVKFDFEFLFDKEAKDSISKIKDELIKEGEKKEKSISILQKSACPGLPSESVRCITDKSSFKEKNMNIIIIIAWIIMVFLGYSSIIEPYILKDNMYGQKTIKYLKFVSGTKNYRAGYMKMDENSYEEEVTQFDKDKKKKIKE